jgi:hypothetical protein
MADKDPHAYYNGHLYRNFNNGTEERGKARRQANQRQGMPRAAVRNTLQGATAAVSMFVYRLGAEIDEGRRRVAFENADNHDAYFGNRIENLFEGSDFEYTARKGLKRIANNGLTAGEGIVLVGIPCLLAAILIMLCFTFGGLAREILPIVGEGMTLFSRGLTALLIMVCGTIKEIFEGIALKMSRIE